jgi:endonuclease III
MKSENIPKFFATLKAANPMPVTELEYTSVFELLTAVLLSAQATDVGVNKATRKLFPVANTPAKILALGLDGLESYIKTIGLYHSKAKHLLQTCRYPHFPHGQPHRASTGQNAARSRAEAAETHPARIPGGRAPLADFAWAVCVYGT